MFTLGIIEESLADKEVLKEIGPYLVKQKTETVPATNAQYGILTNTACPTEK